jgi:flagellar biosynthesis protein FliR
VTLSVDPAWLEAFSLSSIRMIAFIVIAPPFSTSAFPARVKAILAVGLALAVTPRLAEGIDERDTTGFLLALGGELVVGALLGFMVYLVYAALQSAGGLIDLFGGFQLAQGYDPQMMVNGAQFSRLLNMAAMALLFASGAYQLVLGGLLRSFDAIPVGADLDLGEPAQALIGATSQMFLAALQIAGPLIVVLFLADAGLGLLTRVAPALNAFQLGFPVKILVTLVLAATAFVGLPAIMDALTGDVVELVTGPSSGPADAQGGG